MTTLKAGDKAPEFIAKNQNGEDIKLSDFKGKKLLLYFYPKDNTPGCTAESCNLSDNYHTFLKNGFQVLGVSTDNEKSHKNFISKYNLPFDLLVDTEKVIVNLYGVYGEKKLYGKPYMGTIRTTFIIDEKGFIENIIDKVDTKAHAAQILI
jgi:thioredoxin-dependent peroxiredoxin